MHSSCMKELCNKNVPLEVLNISEFILNEDSIFVWDDVLGIYCLLYLDSEPEPKVSYAENISPIIINLEKRP